MAKHTQHTYDPDYIVAPGETLQETIDALGLTQRELAQRMGRPVKTINEIIKGVASITPDTSLQLEMVTGVPAVFWNNSEANYRVGLAKINEIRQMETQAAWLSQFSFNEMVEKEFLKDSDDVSGKVISLLSFFGVVSPSSWETNYGDGLLEGAARAARGCESNRGDLSAWLRVGEILSQRIDTPLYSAKAFGNALIKIRSLTRQNPACIWGEVLRLCAESGVAVVLVPELRNTHIHGFTRWINPDKALIQLSVRHKRDDILWFSLFHEAAHILKHGKRDKFFEFKGQIDPKEIEADTWATDFLIPRKEWDAFTSKFRPGPHARIQITSFAERMGIADSIVLGRLQHDKILPYSQLTDIPTRVDIAWEGLV